MNHLSQLFNISNNNFLNKTGKGGIMKNLLSVANAEGIRGTVIGEILEIMGKKDFVSIPVKIEDGEEGVGEMTDLEKAIFSLIMKTVQRQEEIMAEIAVQEPFGFMLKITEDRKIIEKIENLRKKNDNFQKLMWMIINERLENRYDAVGIREGFKLVNATKKEIDGEDCDCPICQLRKKMKGIIEARKMEYFSSPDGKIHGA